ncbi:MAG: HAMP domain-containing histidine kinase [Lachnospiraceae bacterium]|nr:HAMP domain-containing histidine kinase [Lachnospiraceae bacterium]
MSEKQELTLKKGQMLKMFGRMVLPDTIFYFGGFYAVNLFYKLSTGNKVEFLYPFTLALFFYLIWMGIKAYGFYHFYSKVPSMVGNAGIQKVLFENEKAYLARAFQVLHGKYRKELTVRDIKEEEKRRFLSSWIHMMKTPVTVNDLILERMETKKILPEEAIRDIQAENKRLYKNLDMVLGLQRLEEFSKDYMPEAFDLTEFIRTIINENRRQFIYGNVFPKLTAPEGKTMILSDRKWNRHMVEQILSNAVKYSYQIQNEEEKEEKTEVQTAGQDEMNELQLKHVEETEDDEEPQKQAKNIYITITPKKQRVILTIQDEGIGIPSYDMGRIFEPFFTGENGRKQKNASGIGLYFCKEISEMLGCMLQVDSVEHKGTRVTIAYLQAGTLAER